MARRRRRRKRGGCLTAILVCLTLIVLTGTAAIIMVSQGIPQRLAREFGKKYNPVPFQANSILEEEVAKKYFYELLTQEEQRTYQELLQGISRIQYRNLCA